MTHKVISVLNNSITYEMKKKRGYIIQGGRTIRNKSFFYYFTRSSCVTCSR